MFGVSASEGEKQQFSADRETLCKYGMNISGRSKFCRGAEEESNRIEQGVWKNGVGWGILGSEVYTSQGCQRLRHTVLGVCFSTSAP